MKVSFFGDSHMNLLKAADINLALENYIVREHIFTLGDDELRVRFFASASATGLANANSTTGVSSEVPEFIRRDLVDGVTDFVFHFGKVDLDFVLPYKCLKVGAKIDETAFIDRAAQSMIGFLSHIRDEVLHGRGQIHILGISAPTLDAATMVSFVKRESILEDVEQKLGGRRDLNYMPSDEQISEMLGTRAHRTVLCRLYNDRLRELSQAQGISFIDLFSATIDPVTGELADIYNSHVDHHAIRESMSQVIYELTKGAINPTVPAQ